MCGDDDRPDAWAVSTTVEPTTVKRIQPAVRRWPAALTLAILAPLIAEPWRRIDPCQQGLDITVLRLRLQRRIRITWTQPHIWSSSGCWPLPSSPGAAQSSGGTARPADTAYPITRGHRCGQCRRVLRAAHAGARCRALGLPPDRLAWLAPVVALGLLAAGIAICRRWSTSARWSPVHSAALVAGALPAHSLLDLVDRPLGTVDRVALAVIMAAEFGLSVWLVRRSRHDTSAA
jgi:hypothetical protein